MLADFYTYWTGAPNASPSVLVPLTDRVIEVLTWDGTRFTPFDLVANSILAAGTVGAKTVAANAITAEKLSANAVTAGKLAANSVTAEKLVADAVTAAKLAADSVQARNIVSLAITTDKLAANSVTTAKHRVTEDMTVALLNAHRIQAGDIVSGAITADKLAANAVNADKLAANSVNSSKIVSGAITTDKLATNSITAVKIAAGTITSDKVAAGQFRGYVFTGAIFQSSEAADTGVKLNSTALQMWDSSHNRTVYLDGEGKSNVLTGTFQTALTGKRIRVSPDFEQFAVGSDQTFEGSGIEFKTGRDGQHAYIASEIRSNRKGEISTLTFNGGLLGATDPGSFMRLGEYKATDNATKTGNVFLSAYRDYSKGGQGGYAQLFLQTDPTSKYHTIAELSAADTNGSVGLEADINSGYLYLGGFVGGYGNGRKTFATYYPRGGSLNAGGWITQTWTYDAPAKYGLYHAHVSADSMGSIAAGSNHDSPSGCNLWARGVGNGNGTPYGYQILAILAKQ